MNILMISIDYPPVPGGISAHVYELSKALSAKGNKVSVVTRRRVGEKKQETLDGIDIYRVPLRFMALIYGLQIRRFVRKLLPTTKPDIIHIHGMGPLEWYNISHIPLAYTNHTSGYLKRIQKGGWRRITMLKRYFKKVDLFLAPSKELLHIPFEIDAPKRFIANGVDGNKFLTDPAKRKEIRTKLQLDDNDLVAIVTRRLVDKNGVIYLARATALLKDQNLKFIVIGDGPERTRVEKEFKKNCGDRAIFLGSKKHHEIVEYYSAADFSILPSLMEATSISGLEAMAASLPIVGTNVGGIPELIQGSKNGYLCEPADPLDLAAKIEILLRKNIKTLGLESRRMVEECFDWQRIAEQTMVAYDKVSPKN
ncbi:MAG: glycosyltransferase family 4 protein [Desulfobulbaceae bacterium]|nr:glycosyltransferase family 4 protein [Desulfobulbaceae bacterium]